MVSTRSHRPTLLATGTHFAIVCPTPPGFFPHRKAEGSTFRSGLLFLDVSHALLATSENTQRLCRETDSGRGVRWGNKHRRTPLARATPSSSTRCWMTPTRRRRMPTPRC